MEEEEQKTEKQKKKPVKRKNSTNPKEKKSVKKTKAAVDSGDDLESLLKWSYLCKTNVHKKLFIEYNRSWIDWLVFFTNIYNFIEITF